MLEELKEIKEYIEYLKTHNKNYTKKQYYTILNIEELTDGLINDILKM